MYFFLPIEYLFIILYDYTCLGGGNEDVITVKTN